jgi:hypothetical protein
MGEVFKPEDIILKKERHIPDLTPRPIPQPASLETIQREIESMKAEITKIKQTLRAHGISVE